MAEDYSSKNFNSYNSEQSQAPVDPCSLYVKSVPAYLNSDSFQSKFSEHGRVVRFKLYPALPDRNVTCGLVSYETPAEAQEAIHQLNRKPPLHLEIHYAKPNPKTATSKDVNMNLTKNDQSSTPNDSKTLGRGRCQAKQIDIPALKIQVDGNKRITTSYSLNERKQDKSLSTLHIPELIPNPNFLCIVCKKPGEFSCGACKKPYCSSACQTEDWKHHMSICEPVSEKKGNGTSHPHCKYDNGYCSNTSDTEKKPAKSPLVDPAKNKFQNLPSRATLLPTPEPQVPQQGAFPRRSPKAFGSSKKESTKTLNFIKGNEIEDSSLPLNKDEKVYVCNFQSPSKLWLHLKKATSVLSEMEKRLSDVVDKSAVVCTVNDVCCAEQDGKLRRIKVTEIMPNGITAEFIDFGGTSFIKNNLIYHLPLTFKEYSSQAICCKLVDDDGKANTQWNDDDFTSFHQYTKNKEFKVKAYRCYNNIYDVSLVSEEGVSLYDIARSLLEIEDAPSGNLSNQVPSVLSNLKEGIKVDIIGTEFDKEKFWGILMYGSELDTCLTDLEVILKNVDTEVVNISSDEGDLALGFSEKYKSYFRCVILKRLRNSFLVRSIDYGNSEEITELRSITQPLLQKKSYAVCCTKPNSLSFERFQKAFENTVNLVVTSVNKSVIELSFTYESHPFILHCFPWYHEISTGHSQPPTCTAQEKEGTSFKSNTSNSRSLKTEVRSNENKFCKPLIQNSFAAQSLVSKAGGTAQKTPERVLKDSIPEKKLTVGSRHKVNISFVKNGNVLEVYVQFTEDEKRIISLSLQINQYCLTDTCPKYSPVKDEIVCCLFSADNSWYRAQVLAKVGENKFKVLFIDFGNEDIVSDANMKPLPQKFVSMKLSACVSLFNVKTEDISNMVIIKRLEESCIKNESWVMEVKDTSTCAKVMLFQGQKSLLELINVKTKFLKSSLNYQKLSSNAVSEVIICHADIEKLYFHRVEDLKAINDLQEKINSGDSKELTCKPEINNVYCCLYEGLWYRACVQSEVSPNMFSVNFIDYGNDANVLTKDFKEISKELFALPVYCITVITDTEHSKLLPETPYSIQVIEEKAGIQKVKFLNFSEDTQQNVFLSSFEKLTLKNGVNEVVFCHSEDGVYYCQLKEHVENFTTMSGKLQNAELQPLIDPPKVSEVICAKSSDGDWYRASVESIHTSNYKVFFIDFGNLEVVATENVKVLPIDFHKYPIFSIPVRITNITEAKIDMKSVFFLKPDGFASDGSQFVEIVLSKNTHLPNISSLKNTLLPVDKEVEVALCHLENNICYFHMTSSQKLIQSIELELINAATFGDLSDLPNEGDVICAKFTDGIWYRGSVKSVSKERKSCQIFFIDYGNSEAIELKDLKMIPTKLCEIPILALPMEVVNFEELKKQLLANVSVFKIKVIKKLSDNIPVVELVIPKNDIVPSSIETLSLPESLTQVTITHKEGEIFYVQKESDSECVNDMLKHLQEDSSVKPIVSPEVGQLVCVKFTDGFLYRGLIKEKSGNKAKVFFVDYGNTDIVTEIFMLPSTYSSFPMFSIPVIISNEDVLTSPLKVDSLCKVKYTGKMTNGVQVVRVCPPINHLLLSSIKVPSLETESSDVHFHTFDGQFYFVSKATDIAKFNEMKSMLASFTGNEIYHVPSVEEVLLVKFEELWYRGFVTKIDETKKNCEVFLIDLGAAKTIPFSDISYIPKSITSFPIFLIKVSLSPDHPFQTLISFGKRYTITVVENTTDVPIIKVLQPLMFTSIKRKSLPVNDAKNVIFFHKENDIMFLQDLNDAVQITEVHANARQCALSKVVSHNPIVGELLCAQSDNDGDWYRCCIEEVVDADRYKILYIDYGNSEVVSKKNLRYLSNNLSMYPAFGIAVKIIDQLQVELERQYSVMAVGEPVNSIQFVKLLLEKKVSNPPAVDIMSKHKPNQRFLCNSLEDVTFVEGEQDIVIFSVATDCVICCAPFITRNLEANRELTEKITEYCKSLNSSSYNGDSLILDEMVLAKCDDDQKWYRAVVTECKDPFYEVAFVDSGRIETLHKDFLRKMEKKFMSLPIQSVVCTLKGFKAIGDSMINIEEELKKFSIVVYPEPLKANVTIIGEDTAIEIPFITNYLVEMGLATFDRS